MESSKVEQIIVKVLTEVFRNGRLLFPIYLLVSFYELTLDFTQWGVVGRSIALVLILGFYFIKTNKAKPKAEE